MEKKQKINIFIVDDSKVFSLALKADIENVFGHKNIELHLFETGEKCIDEFKKIMPQIVVLDYFLNGSDPAAADGIEVLDWIMNCSKKTNVVMLTANDSMDIAVKARQHGAVDYVVKTETKFKKINYSLSNIFRIIDAEKSLKNTKQFIYLFILIIAVIFILMLSFQFFKPDMLNR